MDGGRGGLQSMGDENPSVPRAAGGRIPLWLAALAALLFCAGECVYGYWTGSGDVVKGGEQWLYDVLIYGLAAASLGRTRSIERRVAFFLLAIFVFGGFDGMRDVWAAVLDPAAESKEPLASDVFDITGCVAEAMALIPLRTSRNPVLEATWLSARNSVLASVASAVVAVVCQAFTMSWPRIAVIALESLLAFQAAFVVARDVKTEDGAESSE
jgi:Co/Zn/Cd efflux system component